MKLPIALFAAVMLTTTSASAFGFGAELPRLVFPADIVEEPTEPPVSRDSR